MPQKKQDKLEAKQEALEAWSQLPQGTPSREALPPAGDGLGYLFRWFGGIVDAVRRHKRLFAVIAVLFVVGVVALRLWF